MQCRLSRMIELNSCRKTMENLSEKIRSITDRWHIYSKVKESKNRWNRWRHTQWTELSLNKHSCGFPVCRFSEKKQLRISLSGKYHVSIKSDISIRCYEDVISVRHDLVCLRLLQKKKNRYSSWGSGEPSNWRAFLLNTASNEYNNAQCTLKYLRHVFLMRISIVGHEKLAEILSNLAGCKCMVIHFVEWLHKSRMALISI